MVTAPSVRVLVVDDEDVIRAALGKFLRSCGYEVQTAASGAAAVDLLGKTRFTLILCDVRMPGMSGLDVLREAVSRDEDVAVVMLTGVNDAPTATEALAAGALDYLVKPIELEDLRQAVERGLKKRTLEMEQRRVERLIREEVAVRTTELEEEKRALRSLTIAVAEALITAMEAKDEFLRGHSERVAEMAGAVANHLGLDSEMIAQVRVAGRLHDVGKIGIRESVLNKPGELTPGEFEHVKSHVALSVEILTPLKHLGAAVAFVHDHHEHFDGTGYPRRLSGEAISLGGRILCAADAFDALISPRAYRRPLGEDAAVAYLGERAGTLLDPAVYAALRVVVGSRRSGPPSAP
ncbi:MAG: response regulator [Gemmatimonadaceae bacterium]